MKVALNKSFLGERIYIFGLVLLAASLPLSKFMITISEFIIVAGWLMSSNLTERIRQFFRTPSAWMFSAIYVLFVIGIFYSLGNLEHGLKELRIKLPVLILPFVISTAPALSRKQWRYVVGFFIAAVLVGSGIATYVLSTTDVQDTRDISPFISHIRFGLMLSLAFFACIYFAWNTMLWYLRLLMIVLSAWILIFLVLLESVTGLGITITLGILMLIYMIFKKGKIWVRLLSFISLLAIIVFAVFFARNIINEELVAPEVDFSELEETTAKGNPYYHDTTSTWHENGHYIYLYICEPEMKKAWNKRSDIPYSGYDKRNQKLKYTLIRFLNSKGLRKDAKGVQQLNKEEVQAIENGIANINYMQRSSLRARLSQIIYEYKNYRLHGDPSGHSVMQRLEYWKAAIGIIKENPLIGVGTGDINQSFNTQYKKMDTRLDEKYRLRSHNQYLRIGATLGLLGLGLFLLFLLYPIIAARAWEEALFMPFLFIVLMSMITEDTLETQVGANFFAFFFAFLLWGRRNIFTKRR
ncbi:MAG: O-antigen ligase family protein [Bacteroidales bacterium]